MHARPEQVLGAAIGAAALADDVNRRHLAMLQSASPLACHEGCHWCCNMKVTASAPEVLLIAHHLETTTPASELARIKGRVRELALDPRIFSSDDKPKARIPCALLSPAGACTIYAVRPLACRGWNALDADACRRSLDDESELGDMNVQLARDCAVVSVGLLEGLQGSGLGDELLELTAGLDIALHEPGALERWVSGERLFAQALSARDTD